jgi:hypothetical protein
MRLRISYSNFKYRRWKFVARRYLEIRHKLRATVNSEGVAIEVNVRCNLAGSCWHYTAQNRQTSGSYEARCLYTSERLDPYSCIIAHTITIYYYLLWNGFASVMDSNAFYRHDKSDWKVYFKRTLQHMNKHGKFRTMLFCSQMHFRFQYNLC